MEATIEKKRGEKCTYFIVALTTKDGVKLSFVLGREREELRSNERRLSFASSLELDESLIVATENGGAEVSVDSSDQVVDATVLGKELLVEVSPSVLEEAELVAGSLDRSTRGKEAEELGSKVDLGHVSGLVGSAGGILLLLLHLESVSDLGRSSERALELLTENVSNDPGVERLRRNRDLNLETGGGGDGQSSKERAVAVAVTAALAAAGGELDIRVVGRSVLDARHVVVDLASVIGKKGRNGHRCQAVRQAAGDLI